ncbi:MAG: CDP-alcohol phosphatidyltransferase family protein [Actinomycetota bacterium]|nr:CDP-alcohol phosphatidyltransferase family protein [Actinomycetota bacterium]
MRDLPAPRRNRSIIGPLFQRIFTWPYRITLAALFRSGVRPWQLTLGSLAVNVVVGWLLLTGRRFLPGMLLIPAGVLDVFDGGVARMRGEDSRLGAFLDSTLDRVSDGILFGCLFWSLAGQGHHTAAALAMSTLAISLVVSQIRAEGEALGITLSEGVFQRLERYVALMVGLTAPGALLPVLAVLTGLGGLTVAQRGWSAWRRLSRPAEPEPAGPQPGGDGWQDGQK